MRPGHHPLVDPRELLKPVVESAVRDLAGGRVEDPPVEGEGTAAAEPGDVVGTFVLDHVHHDPAVLVVVGVEGVEDPARVDLEPPDLGGVAVAGQQADAGLVGWVPGVGELDPGRGGGHAERDGQVEQDDVVPGQGEVVHHGAVRDRDAGRLSYFAGRADDDVLDVVPGPVVGDGVQFPGAGVELGVRGVPAGQCP